MTVFEKKAALRPACLAVRKNIPPAVRAAADAALCRHVAALPAFAEADLLLLYAPVRGEPSLLPLLARAKEAGIPVAFPRCMGVQMHFHPVSDPNEMLPDRFGIPAPAADARPLKPFACCPALPRGGTARAWAMAEAFMTVFSPRLRG